MDGKDTGADDTATAATIGPTATLPHEDGGVLARYRLAHAIGKGGMGEVISAHDDQIGRQVAIKRMLERDAPSAAVARFVREAQIQGRLDHPAIVSVYELSRDEAGRPFFVMKQIAGTTLAQILATRDEQRATTFTRRRLLGAFVEVCLAIEFAHRRGIIHRDLKPANIMLGDFGEIYVLDWGIAKVTGESQTSSRADLTLGDASATAEGALLGTPGYMSPEQIRGDADLDGRADVYALACILFELLAEEPAHPRGAAGLASAGSGHPARARCTVSARDGARPRGPDRDRTRARRGSPGVSRWRPRRDPPPRARDRRAVACARSARDGQRHRATAGGYPRGCACTRARSSRTRARRAGRAPDARAARRDAAGGRDRAPPTRRRYRAHACPRDAVRAGDLLRVLPADVLDGRPRSPAPDRGPAGDRGDHRQPAACGAATERAARDARVRAQLDADRARCSRSRSPRSSSHRGSPP